MSYTSLLPRPWLVQTAVVILVSCFFAGFNIQEASAVDCSGAPYVSAVTIYVEVDANTRTCALTGAPGFTSGVVNVYVGNHGQADISANNYHLPFDTCSLTASGSVTTLLYTYAPKCTTGNPGYTVTEASATGINAVFTLTKSDLNGGNPLTISITYDFNGSIATVQSASVDFGDDTQSSFIQNRASVLLNNQPNITSFLDNSFAANGGAFGAMSLVGSPDSYSFAFATSLGNYWTEMSRREMAAFGGAEAPSAAQDGAALPRQTAEDAAFAYRSAEAKAADETLAALDTNAEPAPVLSEAQNRGYDVWMQLNGSRASAGDADSNLWIGYLGAHKFITPDLLIGAVAQVDFADEENDVSSISADGMGWMTGPYMAARLPGQNIYFDARAAWGMSDNELDLTASSGSYDTERWLVSAKLSGRYSKDNLTFQPAVSVSYFEERQESYQDSTSTLIDAQTFSQGEVRFGPTLAYHHTFENGFSLTPRLGVNGIWNFGVKNGNSTDSATLDSGEVRAALDAGLTAVSTRNWSVDVNGFYDGLGINDYDSYGGRVRLTISFR